MKLLVPLSLLCLTLVTAQEGVDPDTGALPSSAADGVDPITTTQPRRTIYGFLKNDGQYQILTSIIEALPNTSATLDEPGARFTLFAPNDSAFRDLARRVTGSPDLPTSAEVVQQIVDGIEAIKKGPGFTNARGILFYHLLNTHYTFAQLEDLGSVTTAQGKNVSFVDGLVRDLDPSRPDANAFQKNIFTQNGWVHAVDSVLLPFDLERAIQVSRPTPSPTPSPSLTPIPSGTVRPTPTPTSTPTPSPTEDGSPLGPTPADDTAEPSVSEEAPGSEDDDAVCFPSTARVHTPQGTVTMDQLEAGQEVLHHESGKSSKVFLFTHRTKAYDGWFYRITTATGHAVTMTGNHYVYANDRLTAADAVIIGNTLRTVSGVSPVVKVEKVKGTGLYAPHSVHGDLVVDGVVVSGYSRAMRPGVAHAVLAPVRWLVKVSGIREPFGGLLYEGGRGIDKYLPKGKSRY